MLRWPCTVWEEETDMERDGEAEAMGSEIPFGEARTASFLHLRRLPSRQRNQDNLLFKNVGRLSGFTGEAVVTKRKTVNSLLPPCPVGKEQLPGRGGPGLCIRGHPSHFQPRCWRFMQGHTREFSLCFKINATGLPWWRSGWESACQCRGHGFEPWSGKIPHAAEWLGPWATITEPARLEPVLRSKRGRDSERPAHRDEEWPPLAATGESPCTETKTQHSHK